jgi:type II secretory pathway component PulM
MALAVPARLRAFWAARQPRERVFLIVLASIVGAALLAQVLWTSHQARARLKKQIPQLQRQVETLQRKATDLQQLRAQQPGPAPVASIALLASAVASANAAALPEAAKQLQQEGPGRLRLRATLPFDRWLEWVAALQRDGRIRIVSCRIEPSDAPGSAKIDALFSLPEAG